MGKGEDVLREIKLRAWHKTGFRDELVRDIILQGELMRRFEAFLAPLTRKLGRVESRSHARASILKHTIELWSYLDAAHGTMGMITPLVGSSFDRKISVDGDELPSQRTGSSKVKWLLRRGFIFRQMGVDGRTIPAVVLVR